MVVVATVKTAASINTPLTSSGIGEFKISSVIVYKNFFIKKKKRKKFINLSKNFKKMERIVLNIYIYINTSGSRGEKVLGGKQGRDNVCNHDIYI